jgi:hypothetical protein
MKRIRLDTCYEVVIEILNKYGIIWWVESGTLLGAVREHKRISWDRDYDLAYYSKDALKIYRALQELPKEYCLTGCYGFAIWDTEEMEHLVCLKPHAIKKGNMYVMYGYFEYIFCKLRRNLWKEDKIFKIKKMHKISNRFKVVRPLLTTIDILFSFCGKCRCSAENYRAFIKIKLNNTLANIPIGFENNLITHYGKNWRTPMRKGEYIPYDKRWSGKI